MKENAEILAPTATTANMKPDIKTRSDKPLNESANPVAGFYESIDILILRDALLCKAGYKLRATDNLLVKTNNIPSDYATYLLSPLSSAQGFDGLKEAICVALLNSATKKEILFPFKMDNVEHWVTGHLIINNQEIIFTIHDSAKYYQQANSIEIELKKFLDSTEAQIEDFLSARERCLACKENKPTLKQFFCAQNPKKIKFANLRLSHIFTIQNEDAYCGGYSTRLMVSLAVNPKQNIKNKSVWQCENHANENELRIEDARTVTQYNPSMIKKFGTRTRGDEYLNSKNYQGITNGKKEEQLSTAPVKFLSDEGFFAELPLNLDEIGKNTSLMTEEHQKILEGYFQYLYMKVKAELKIEPWRFGCLECLQAVCCGKIFNSKDFFTKMEANKKCCPECNSPEIQDQLYCMNAELLPYTKDKDKKTLTLELLKKSILNKCHFLLEHLLKISTIVQYINFTDQHGKALIHYAIEKNDNITMLILVKHGANVDVPNIREPTTFLKRLVELDFIKEDTAPMELILKQYGKQKVFTNGHKLHHVCRTADELALCQLLEEGVDVNSLDTQNYTPLAVLAYFGTKTIDARAISLANLWRKLVEKELNQYYFLEFLFLLKEKEYIDYECSCSYGLGKNQLVDLYIFLRSKFKYMNISCDADEAVLVKNDKSETIYFYYMRKMAFANTKKDTSVIDDIIKEDFLDFVMEKEKFSGKLIIPCLNEIPSIATLTIKKEKTKIEAELTIEAFALRIDVELVETLEAWVFEKLKVKPRIISVIAAMKDFGLKTLFRQNMFFNVLKHVYKISNIPFGEETIGEYVRFRANTSMYRNGSKSLDFNDFNQQGDQVLLSLIGKESLQKILETSKQCFMIEMLLAYNADAFTDTDNCDRNVFSIAERAYNYNFVKKLIELDVPFFSRNTTMSLIKSTSYSYPMLCEVLCFYAKHKYKDQLNLLHVFVTLVDGSVAVDDRERGGDQVVFLERLFADKEKDGLKWMNEQSAKGETPLYLAIRYNNLSAALTLIRQGASLFVQNKYDEYPIDLILKVANKNFIKEMCEITIQLKSSNDETALFAAIRAKKLQATKVFLKHQYSVLVKNKENKFPVDVTKELAKDFAGKQLHALILKETELQLAKALKDKLCKLEQADIKRLSETHGYPFIASKSVLNQNISFEFTAKSKIPIPSTSDCENLDEPDIDDDLEEDIEARLRGSSSEHFRNSSDDDVESAAERESDHSSDDEDDEEQIESPKTIPLDNTFEPHLAFKQERAQLASLLDAKNSKAIKELTDKKLNQLREMSNIQIENINKQFSELYDCLTSALLLLRYQSKIKKSYEAKFLELFQNIILNQKIPLYFKIKIYNQIMLTVGLGDISEKILGSLADILRHEYHKGEKSKDCMFLAFLCYFMNNNHVLASTFLKKNLTIHHSQETMLFLEQHNELFSSLSNWMGFCCMMRPFVLSEKRDNIQKLISESASAIPVQVKGLDESDSEVDEPSRKKLKALRDDKPVALTMTFDQQLANLDIAPEAPNTVGAAKTRENDSKKRKFS